MATNTSIEWTRGDDGAPGATWNPLLGCERVSAGCDHCYAINTATIRAGNPHPKVAAAFEGLTERRDGRLDWTGRINLLPDRLTQPLSWRKPKRIFVNSQADLFHKDVPDEYIAKVFAVMALAPQHTFQVLTKRHARMRSLLNKPEFRQLLAEAAPLYGAKNPDAAQDYVMSTWPLPNVWLGVSVEDQKWANVRVPALLDTPAAVRWLSCEPLLGPVDLWEAVRDLRYACHACEFGTNRGDCNTHRPERLDWVVVGGESGPGARPMHPRWARSLRRQCTEAGVPYFFKQWGDWAEVDRASATHLLQVGGVLVDRKNATTDNPYGQGSGLAQDFVDRGRPGWVRVRRVGKKFAGRELDGRTWDEYPTTAAVVTS